MASSKPVGRLLYVRRVFTDLSEEGLFVSQLVLQFVVDVVDGGGLSLGAQVAFFQSDDPFLHVLLLTHGLHENQQKLMTKNSTEGE